MTGTAPLAISMSGITDFAAVEAKWRDLELRSEPSFFQSWTWTGCLVAERFPDPVLVEAREGDRIVALALFNRRGRTLFLGESGDPALDGIYIEFNGVLAVTGREVELTTACLDSARHWPCRDAARDWPRRDPGFGAGFRAWFETKRLVLNGVDARTAASIARTGLVRGIQSRDAPYAMLSSEFINRRSANTRQQLRRSDRYYAGTGSIAVERAATLDQAQDFLTRLSNLHQRTWAARGRPGAFAEPFFVRFHQALIERGLDRAEIDLLRVAAGGRDIGFLYNFRFRGRSLAYQSGFDYDAAERHGKPGLTCHHQAIGFLRAAGVLRYDFLAGDDRYKRSLSDNFETLYWIEVGGWFSPGSLARRFMRLSARHL